MSSSDSEDPRIRLKAQIQALRSRIDPNLLEQVRTAYLAQLRGEAPDSAEQANAKQAVELYLQEKKKNAALLQQLARNLRGARAATQTAPPPPAAPARPAPPPPAADPLAGPDRPLVPTGDLRAAISDFFNKLSRRDRKRGKGK
jgi:hypothetical protein